MCTVDVSTLLGRLDLEQLVSRPRDLRLQVPVHVRIDVGVLPRQLLLHLLVHHRIELLPLQLRLVVLPSQSLHIQNHCTRQHLGPPCPRQDDIDLAIPTVALLNVQSRCRKRLKKLSPDVEDIEPIQWPSGDCLVPQLKVRCCLFGKTQLCLFTLRYKECLVFFPVQLKCVCEGGGEERHKGDPEKGHDTRNCPPKVRRGIKVTVPNGC
mmetsp:Transcript_37193/g.87202  ORF Transcript_37193/g.87202 Transcript_37193/m.87202 type:complete len:209 (-) Transcript_37193:8-634(-)